MPTSTGQDRPPGRQSPGQAVPLAWTAEVRPDQVTRGMHVIHGGQRWQVRRTEPAAGGAIRLRLRRPAAGPGRQIPACWTPGGPVRLSADQGTCRACGLALTPGLAEEAHSLRTAPGGRYFCAASDDALHHPQGASA
jgi:hypothetical protein